MNNPLLTLDDKKHLIKSTKYTVIGHKNPDTDAVVSALVEAVEKQAMSIIKNKNKEYIPSVTGDITKETASILKMCNVSNDVLTKESDLTDKNIILVDHNDIGNESIKGASQAKINYILDHHRLALTTESPTKIRIEKVGATATIVAEKIFEKMLKYPDLPEKMGKILPGYKKLLLSAIITDTDGFKSKTTTSKDIRVAQRLSKETKIDLTEFTKEIQEKMVDIAGVPLEKLARIDGKLIEIGNDKLFINQIKINDSKQLFDFGVKFIKEIKKIHRAEKTNAVLQMITNINENASTLIVYPSNNKYVRAAFSVEVAKVISNSDFYHLHNVTSRKLDIIPKLLKIPSHLLNDAFKNLNDKDGEDTKKS